jgi:sugar transferase (PEP-CTERM/EpsH1 system associated)
MADRPHVVHVLDSLQVGGTENGVVNLARALDGGFRQSVLAVTAGGPLAARLPPEVAVHVLGKRPGLDLRAVGRLAGLLRRLGPDIVHSRNWGALDAVVAARLARVPVVIHGEHGREAADPRGLDARRNRIRRLLSPLVTRFVAVSRDLGRWLVDTVGIPRDKVTVICNGVDTERFAEGDRASARRLLGLPLDTVAIGTVGRLDPVKDQLGLLEAFGALPPEVPMALVVVGEGPCRGALAERAACPDVTGRVHLLGERRDVPALLAGLDVFALPSIAEGISNTVLEAMATGLPVVATRVGGNPEMVEDGVTGALVPAGDRPALARALAAYVADPHLRQLHGKAGRQRVVEAWSLPAMAARYAALYRETLAGRDA